VYLHVFQIQDDQSYLDGHGAQSGGMHCVSLTQVDACNRG